MYIETPVRYFKFYSEWNVTAQRDSRIQVAMTKLDENTGSGLLRHKTVQKYSSTPNKIEQKWKMPLSNSFTGCSYQHRLKPQTPECMCWFTSFSLISS